MKIEKSLTRTKNNIFSKIVQTIKRFFSKNRKTSYNSKQYIKLNENLEEEAVLTAKKNEYLESDSELKDMEMLKKVMQGQVEINSLEECTIDRLIELCSKRLEEVNKKIDDKEKQIYKNKKLTKVLKQV